MDHSLIEVRCGLASREIDVTMPDPRSVESLAMLVRSGHGSLSVRGDVDPAPYESLLGRIAVDEQPDRRVLLNIAGVKELDAGRHVHVEYFPEHYYLNRDSFAAVFHS